MRELTMDEREIVAGGVLGADAGGDVSYSHPVLDGADGAMAIIGTAGVAVMIASAPVTVPLLAVAVLGAACGVAIGMAIEN
jgi:hypothetical protein